VIEAVERTLCRAVPRTLGARRAGDPPGLVADPSRARTLLGWSPVRSSLDQIVQDAARWHADQQYGRAMKVNPEGIKETISSLRG
jgi:UDP-glucose 4-epimerase